MQVQIGQKADGRSAASGYATPSSPTSDSEGDDTLVGLAARTRHCADVAAIHLSAPTSHLVAIVCDNCFINHSPEDCIIDGFISDCNTNTADLVSLSGDESSDNGVISIPDDNDDVALPVTPVVEAEGTESRSNTEPSEETGDNQPTSEEVSDNEAPQAISLYQVMMTAPVGTSSGLTAPIIPTTNAATTITAGLVAPHLLASGPQVTTTSAPMAPPITPQ